MIPQPIRFAAALVACLFLATAAPAVAGQDSARPAVSVAVEVPPPDTVQELALRDGTTVFGRVERVGDGRFVFRTTAGAVIEADVAQVRSLRIVRGRTSGRQFYAEDPNPTRLFFGPTGRSLRAGTGYLGVYEVLLPFVQAGITDRISVGGGTPLFFGGDSEHPFWFTPKIQVLSLPMTQASVGVMHFLNVGDGNFGVAYAAVTHGSRDNAITVAAGYAYERSSGDLDGVAIWMVGGERRISRRVKLISENYIGQEGGLASGGLRFMGEHLSSDLALVLPIGAGSNLVFPMVNFVYQF